MSTQAAGTRDDATGDDQTANGDEQRTDAMADQLTHDVTAWNAGRGKAMTRHVAEIGVPSPPEPVRRVRKAKPTAAAAKPATQAGRPFRMSYGGTTTKDYVQYLLDRGAR